MLSLIAFSLYLIIIPFLVLLASKRWKIVDRINPMVILYIIGLIVGNIGLINENGLVACTNFSNVTVLLAIPLMLLSCDFKKWSAKSSLKAFLVGLFSVIIVTITGFYIFRGQAFSAGLNTSEFAKVSAGMTGIYTGGIPNFAPVSKAVGLPQNLFLIISGYDIIVTASYLLVIVFFGRKLIDLLFPKEKQSKSNYIAEKEEEKKEDTKLSISTLTNRALGIVVAIVVVAVSVLLSKIIPIDNSTAVIIIIITTISIMCTFLKSVKKLKGTFDSGLYFVYVFCLAVATMVNLHEMDFSKYLFILFYVAFAVYGSLILQIIGAKIFKISGALTLTASISLINSPPFVPMVAASLNNRDIILPGIAIGLLGYAAGNYLGIGIFYLLEAIPI